MTEEHDPNSLQKKTFNLGDCGSRGLVRVSDPHGREYGSRQEEVLESSSLIHKHKAERQKGRDGVNWNGMGF